MDHGKTLSSVSTSLLNLFIRRPTGVVSKKDMGSLNTLERRFVCSFFAASRDPKDKMNAPPRMNVAVG